MKLETTLGLPVFPRVRGPYSSPDASTQILLLLLSHNVSSRKDSTVCSSCSWVAHAHWYLDNRVSTACCTGLMVLCLCPAPGKDLSLTDRLKGVGLGSERGGHLRRSANSLLVPSAARGSCKIRGAFLHLSLQRSTASA